MLREGEKVSNIDIDKAYNTIQKDALPDAQLKDMPYYSTQFQLFLKTQRPKTSQKQRTLSIISKDREVRSKSKERDALNSTVNNIAPATD